jgi:2-oxoisovalerate dehydrogenase E1 component
MKAAIANAEPEIEASLSEELNDIYKPLYLKKLNLQKEKKKIRFIDAISSSLKQSMERHDNLVIMGQDIAEYGGAFKITDGFVAQFGKTVISICESAVVSAGGMVSINGYKAIVEMQFADFVSTGFNPIVNLLAKSHYRWLEKPMLWCECLAAVELKQDRFIRKLMKLGLQNSGLKWFILLFLMMQRFIE